MTEDSRRLAPLPPDEWPPALEGIKNGLGQPLNIHSVMAHHVALTRAWMPFRNHVVAESSLDPRHRELLILRTALNCDSRYEWEHHTVRGRLAGLSESDIQRLKEHPADAPWPPAERALLQAADDCKNHMLIRDDTLGELGRHFDERQQLDIIATVGMYMILAAIIRTYRVPLEED